MSGNGNRNDAGAGYWYDNENRNGTGTAQVNDNNRKDSRNAPEPWGTIYRGGNWGSESSTAYGGNGGNMSSSWSSFRSAPAAIVPSQLPPMQSPWTSSAASLHITAPEYTSSLAAPKHSVNRENHSRPRPGPGYGSGSSVLLSPFNYSSYPIGYDFPAAPVFQESPVFQASPKPTAAVAAVPSSAVASAEMGGPAGGAAPGSMNKCVCNFCTIGAPRLCHVIARRKAEIRISLDAEYNFVQQSQKRIQELREEKGKITLQHHRQMWDNERTNMQTQINALNQQIEKLRHDKRELYRTIDSLQSQIGSSQSQHNEPPIIHHGSGPVNSPLLNSGPPPAFFDRQSARTYGNDSNHDNTRGLFGGPPKSPVPYVPASPLMSSNSLVPTGYAEHLRSAGTPPIGLLSPNFSPPSPTMMMMMDSAPSGPKRSPKRPASVIEANEVDSRLEDMAPTASTSQDSTSARTSARTSTRTNQRGEFVFKREASSPPSKRRRSMSYDYHLDFFPFDHYNHIPPKINSETDEERLLRLRTFEGYTPNVAPPSPPAAATAGPSRNNTASAASPSPSVDDSNNDGDDDDDGDDDGDERGRTEVEAEGSSRTVATAAAAEGGIVSRPDLATGLGRVNGSSSSSSCPSIPSSPSSQQALLEAMDDAPLRGLLMIQNIPAQDELFLAALKERLEPISQGQDPLPRAVQAPVAARVPLSAVSGGITGSVVGNRNTVPDNTDMSGAQSDIKEEPDKARIKIEPKSPPRMLGMEYSDDDSDDDSPVKIERPVTRIKKETSDSESDTAPEVPLKLRSTCNFGAPFGKM